MRIKNLTGRDQEIHYIDNTVIVENNGEHELRIDKIMRPEYGRVKRIFHHLADKQESKKQPAKEIIKAEEKQYFSESTEKDGK